jgi:hypothetical protein
MKITITQAEADAGLAVFTVPTEDTQYIVELVTECPNWGSTHCHVEGNPERWCWEEPGLTPVPGVWTVEWVPAEGAFRCELCEPPCVEMEPDNLSEVVLGHRIYDHLDLTPGRMVGIARREDR